MGRIKSHVLKSPHLSCGWEGREAKCCRSVSRSALVTCWSSLCPARAGAAPASSSVDTVTTVSSATIAISLAYECMNRR